MKDIPVIICCPEGQSRFTDNLEGHCASCGCKVVWRPYLPEPSTKLCFDCGIQDINDCEARGEAIQVETTPEQKQEIESILGPGSLAKGIEMMEKIRKSRK